MASLLSQLSPEQRAAAESRARYVRIVAGPGAGKTTTMAARATSLLLDQGVSPRCLVCVSFTRKAALELRERVELSLAQALGPDRGRALAGQVTFGTMHSYCLGGVRNGAGLLGLPDRFTVIDEFDRVDVRAELKRRYRVTGEALDRLYTQFKAEQGMIDFDDILVFEERILREIWLPAGQRSSSVFLYDEFQDVSEIEHRILGHLKPAGLTVVGDPDQNIYAWRGSDNRFLLDFPTAWPDAASYTLATNYRSTRAVVEAADRLIAHNAERLAVEHKAVQGGGQVQVSDRPPSLASALPGPPWRRFAVLARTNREVERAALDLTRAGIPCRVLGDGPDFWGAPSVRLCLHVLRWLDNPRNGWALERIIASGLLGEVTEPVLTDLRLQASMAGRRFGDLFLESPASANLKLARWAWDGSASLPLILRIIAEFGQLGVRAHFADRLRTGKADLVDALVQRIAEWAASEDRPTLTGFLGWQAMRSAQDAAPRRDDDVVTLGTIHAAKGLEWDYVVVLTAGLPSKRAPIEEERRLLYVALTRARRNALVLTEGDCPFIAEMGTSGPDATPNEEVGHAAPG